MPGVKGLAISIWMIACSSLHAAVVPDGTTDTIVSVDSLNRIVIDIAPPNADRISHNRYETFNVARDGVMLNNRTAAARTIINEVTSLQPTTIEGELRVLGTRAHLIIANPNGISVNGAEFFNVASMALATGMVGYQERTDEFGATYYNPALSVTGGEIYVGSDGLKGVINQLELISRSFVLDGSIVNENESAFSGVNIRAGASDTEFNSKLSVADPAGEWAVTSARVESSGVLAVDITSRSSLSASRISMMVTDAGAGVRIGGDILATANDFTLTSDGLVSVTGNIKAAGAVAIVANNIESESRLGEQNIIESQYSNVSLSAAENLYLTGTLVSARHSESDYALLLNAGESIRLDSRNGEERTILFSHESISINSPELINYSSKIVANTGLSIIADSFNNGIFVNEFDGRAEHEYDRYDGNRLWYTAYLERERVYKHEINFGEPVAGRVASEILVGSGDVEIDVGFYQGYGADIIANNGSIKINAEQFTNEAALVGRAWYTARCSLGGCDKRGGSDMDLLGGKIQASNTTEIRADEFIVNRGGVIQAVNDLIIESPDNRSYGTEIHSVYMRTKGLRGFFFRKDALWVSVDQGGALISNMGRIIINGSDLTIDGGRIASAEEIIGNYAVVREPTTQDLLIRRRIGVYEGIF